MSAAEPSPAPVRARRAPPPFRPVTVRRIVPLGPRMVRITFTGPELDGLTVEHPAASVRLLLPSPGTPELVIPSWNGNEFLLPGGERPMIRTFTPRRMEGLDLDIDLVLHGVGVASDWARTTEPGAPAAISGPGRGDTVDLDAPGFLLAGDETAIPAISQLLAAVPAERPVQVLIEVAHPDGRLALPDHPHATVEWSTPPPGSAPGDALVAAVGHADIAPDTRIWAAGEAATMQRIRRHLFEDRGLPRAHASVRGYWKQGSSGDPDDR